MKGRGLIMKDAVIAHYDRLIEEENDPVRDPEPLRAYMDKWDGARFIECMALDKSKSVLEIGVGTGRLALRTAPLCGDFCGIDLSPKTVGRARENLAGLENTELICADFLEYAFGRRFDVIYSSLTFLHIADKRHAIRKAADLLNDSGRFVLSIDKNPGKTIDMGTRKIGIYPDTPEETEKNIISAGMRIAKWYETEFAFVFTAEKDLKSGESSK